MMRVSGAHMTRQPHVVWSDACCCVCVWERESELCASDEVVSGAGRAVLVTWWQHWHKQDVLMTPAPSLAAAAVFANYHQSTVCLLSVIVTAL